MRHRKKKLQLNRFTSWRKSTVIALARSLFLNQRIFTTKHKAKAAQSLAEKLISMAKSNTLVARRRAYQILSDHALVAELFKEIGPRFTKRTSGYTRILPWGKRRGDDAEIVILELTEQKKEKKAPKREKAKEETKEAAKEVTHETKEKPVEPTVAPKPKLATEERPPAVKKPTKKFLGGLRGIFKKERDSL